MKNLRFMGVMLFSLSLLGLSTSKASAFSFGNERNRGIREQRFTSRGDEDKLRRNNGHDNDNNGGDNKGSSAVSLPINDEAWFLVVAGLGIGSCVILNKNKAVS